MISKKLLLKLQIRRDPIELALPLRKANIQLIYMPRLFYIFFYSPH